MLEIKIENCHKCDIETITDPNNSQYCWINRRSLEIETTRNFEKIIKSCKATNLEFLKLQEKLGLCLYEDICDEQELISMSKEIFKEEKVFTQHGVENNQLKEGNEKLRTEKK